MRLVRIAGLRGKISQALDFAFGESPHDVRESFHPIVVLGRQPDRCAKQSDKVSRTVTGRSLNFGDAGRGPHVGTERECPCDRGMDQQRAPESGTQLRCKRTEDGRCTLRRQQPFAQLEAPSTPYVIDGYVTIRELGNWKTQNGAGRAGAKSDARGDTRRFWTGFVIAPLRSMHDTARPNLGIPG